jgi:hypothetical protein
MHELLIHFTSSMRRRELIKLIRGRAKFCNVTFSFHREGANHTIYTLGNSYIKIGRHAPLKPGDGRATLQETEKELGEKWWQ